MKDTCTRLSVTSVQFSLELELSHPLRNSDLYQVTMFGELHRFSDSASQFASYLRQIRALGSAHGPKASP